ncbi:unnamed protein product, partial [marine sediment metagenome]
GELCPEFSREVESDIPQAPDNTIHSLFSPSSLYPHSLIRNEDS